MLSPQVERSAQGARALFVFSTTSTLYAFVWSGPALIALRILQGLGGASIAPMTRAFALQQLE